MGEYLGTGKLLNIVSEHPYIGQSFLKKEKIEKRILDRGKAKYCKNCGQCIAKCPQHIDIPRRLKEVREIFENL